MRIYGWDIEDRMRAGGLAVTRVDVRRYFTAAELDRNGLRGDDEYLFFVRRSAA